MQRHSLLPNQGDEGGRSRGKKGEELVLRRADMPYKLPACAAGSRCRTLAVWQRSRHLEAVLSSGRGLADNRAKKNCAER
ncbi:hypothetical protein cyc_07186 [Cyclospora cayetanensis]|uniref:Uncharacterized protein n=1 Tax=Cyclospora cayetanensis TaxID=88456 RepID=A0A1D3D719_9EIME|nr:hypothetical protein cyc_07186 [Cyclospora cayetanensis]